MSTTISDINRWIREAPENATHMIVLCDTFDYEDYPSYVLEGEDFDEKLNRASASEMTRYMEHYDLRKTKGISGDSRNCWTNRMPNVTN